ncbi:MAG: ornithine cyclodeaminase family protein [Bacteroidota bacterium]
MKIIDKQQVEQLLHYPSLIEALRQAFRQDYQVPQRQHYAVKQPENAKDNTLLLMPAWELGAYLGVKTVMVAPENGRYDLPAIQGVYTLFDAHKGTPLASIDAPALTAKRTAAASALASSYLSRDNSSALLMIGTGALAPELIKAHASVRPLQQAYIWGRNFAKADALARRLSSRSLKVNAVPKIEEAVGQVDIISCATLSSQPLLWGKWLRPGQHIDLVGAYLPDSRESDDAVIQQSQIFVDTRPGATQEAGDLAIPLQQGLIQMEAILADLAELCKDLHPGRQQAQSITLFKSVGHALEDLAAAKLIYSQLHS